MTPGRREHTPATLVFVLPGALGTIIVTAMTIYFLAVNNSMDCPHPSEDCTTETTTTPHQRPTFPDNDLSPFVPFGKGRSRHLHRSERRSRAASETNLTIMDVGNNGLSPFDWGKVITRVQNRRLDLPQRADEGQDPLLVHNLTSAVPTTAQSALPGYTVTTAPEDAAISNAADLPPRRTSIETRTAHFVTSTSTVSVGVAASTTSPGTSTAPWEVDGTYSPWSPKSLWEEAARIETPIWIAFAAVGCLGVLLLGT